MKIVISSGHSVKVPGASGYIQEHPEAVRVVNKTAEYLRQMGATVVTYEEKTATTQDQNLKNIVDFHNAQGPHDLDCFVHFNANVTTSKPMGVECWYMTQDDLAEEIAGSISESSGLIDRGAKYSDGLYVLRHSVAPAVLPEICFVDSSADVKIYQESFDAICNSLAAALAGKEVEPSPEPPEPPEGVLFRARGPCSWFGGPDDDGVSPSEALAFITDEESHLLLPENPPQTTGLARRLNPGLFYVACRWDYDVTPKSMLANPQLQALVRAGNSEFLAWPADWGPHEDTGRVADLSPALLDALELETDDEVEVIYPAP